MLPCPTLFPLLSFQVQNPGKPSGRPGRTFVRFEYGFVCVCVRAHAGMHTRATARPRKLVCYGFDREVWRLCRARRGMRTQVLGVACSRGIRSRNMVFCNGTCGSCAWCAVCGSSARDRAGRDALQALPRLRRDTRRLCLGSPGRGACCAAPALPAQQRLPYPTPVPPP
jgi:hypothetical protein